MLILGGGSGGMAAARRLADAAVRVTLVDRRNHHLFQPLLYQGATASLPAPSIAASLRQILRRQSNRTVLDEVSGIELAAHRVQLNVWPRHPWMPCSAPCLIAPIGCSCCPI